MALVCVIVLAVSLGAITSFETTSIAAQDVLEGKAEIGYAADSAIDAAISGLAADPEAGIFQPSLYEDGQPADSQTCFNYPGLQYPDPNLDSNGDGNSDDPNEFDVEVVCNADDDSGSPVGQAGIPPEFVIRTLGGVFGDGNDGGDASPYPFCDDRHSPTGCEAGIYIGSGVDEGGVRVADNGSPARGAQCNPPQPAGKRCPLVQSNGAIVSRQSGLDRSLNVVGSLFARRACSNVLVYDDGSDEWGTPAGMCEGNDSRDTPMLPDPDYRHEYWDAVAATRNDWGEPTDAALQEVPPHQPSGTWDTGDPDGTGPLTTLGTPGCGDGFMFFRPGRYSELRELNRLMTSCPSTLYWFMPGVYYFDFEDVGAGSPLVPYWRSPTQFSQIVGGTPRGWEPGSTLQPVKSMAPNSQSSQNWSAGGTPYEGRVIDQREARHRFPANTGSSSAEITMSALRTPMPSGATVHDAAGSVALRVKEWHTDGLAADFPRVVVKPRVGKSCVLPLQKPGLGLVDSEGIESFDLTLGCPTDRGALLVGSSATPFPSNASGSTKRWTADEINNLTITYEVRRPDKTQAPQVGLDGVELQVRYTGRPTPSYPGGCDPTGDGVQFIFGNLSRVYMRGSDVHIELCGSEGAKDRHALTVYGLADDYQHRLTENDDGAGSVVPKVPPPRVTATRRYTNATVTANQNFASVPLGVDLGVQGFEKIGDGEVTWTDPAWATGNARLEFTLPIDFVPTGSVIERVEVRVACAVTLARGVALNVTKGPTSGEPSDVSAVVGSFPETSVGCAQRQHNPLNADYIGNVDFTAANAPRWVYGDNLGHDPSSNRPTTAYVNEGDLTNALRTPNALNGATFKLRVDSPGGGVLTQAAIDGIEVWVEYRPPDTLRPLRGCMTLRVAVADGSAPQTMTSDLAGLAAIHHGRPFVTTNDSAYQDGNNAQDTEECAFWNVWSDSNQEGAKLHVVGMVYAPTAALQFAGKDNEAAFVTDGIVARHLNAVRWRRGPNVVAFGGGSVTERDPRHVHLEVWYPSRDAANARLVARAEVKFIDEDGDGVEDYDEVVTWEARL